MGRTLGIIGGSGLYALEGLEGREEIRVSTPFGDPSDVIVAGRVGGVRYLFLPRHGRGHAIPPHRVNYRANVLALKLAGAEQIVSVSAVGSMREHIHPGDFVVVDQFLDRTRHRVDTYFDEPGLVAHVAFAEPVDAALASALHDASVEVGATVHRGGTYLCMEGPQFSTRAESLSYRALGVDVIGMTNVPECKLAREAELPYATLAMATDYDCWHQEHEAVSVDRVLAVMHENVDRAKRVLVALASRVPDPSASPATRALEHAILTSRDAIPSELRTKLAPLVGKYL